MCSRPGYNTLKFRRPYLRRRSSSLASWLVKATSRARDISRWEGLPTPVRSSIKTCTGLPAPPRKKDAISSRSSIARSSQSAFVRCRLAASTIHVTLTSTFGSYPSRCLIRRTTRIIDLHRLELRQRRFVQTLSLPSGVRFETIRRQGASRLGV